MLIQRVYGDYCSNDFHRKYFRELKPCLSEDGRQLYIPAGKQLEVISLEETEKGLVSRRKCKIDMPDEIHAIAIGPSGLIYIAVEEGAQSQISVLRRDNLVLFAELPESPQHMVVTDRYVVVVTETYRGSPLHAVSTSGPTSIYALQPAGYSTLEIIWAKIIGIEKN